MGQAAKETAGEVQAKHQAPRTCRRCPWAVEGKERMNRGGRSATQQGCTVLFPCAFPSPASIAAGIDTATTE